MGCLLSHVGHVAWVLIRICPKKVGSGQWSSVLYAWDGEEGRVLPLCRACTSSGVLQRTQKVCDPLRH